jgi:hypothetical protein
MEHEESQDEEHVANAHPRGARQAVVARWVKVSMYKKGSGLTKLGRDQV